MEVVRVVGGKLGRCMTMAGGWRMVGPCGKRIVTQVGGPARY
jgi:hypothetical protein